MSDFQSLLHWTQSMQQSQPFMQMQPLNPPSLLGTARDIQTYLNQQPPQQNQSSQQLPPLASIPQSTPINPSPAAPLASPSYSPPPPNPQQAVAQAQAAIPQLQSQNGSSGKGGGHGGSVTGAMKDISALLGL